MFWRLDLAVQFISTALGRWKVQSIIKIYIQVFVFLAWLEFLVLLLLIHLELLNLDFKWQDRIDGKEQWLIAFIGFTKSKEFKDFLKGYWLHASKRELLLEFTMHSTPKPKKMDLTQLYLEWVLD